MVLIKRLFISLADITGPDDLASIFDGHLQLTLYRIDIRLDHNRKCRSRLQLHSILQRNGIDTGIRSLTGCRCLFLLCTAGRIFRILQICINTDRIRYIRIVHHRYIDRSQLFRFHTSPCVLNRKYIRKRIKLCRICVQTTIQLIIIVIRIRSIKIKRPRSLTE